MGEPLKRRKERIECLKGLIEANPTWDDVKLLTFFCFATGITKKTALDYLLLIKELSES